MCPGGLADCLVSQKHHFSMCPGGPGDGAGETPILPFTEKQPVAAKTEAEYGPSRHKLFQGRGQESQGSL